MTDREVMQQALDAWDDPAGMKDLCVAMDALKAALAMHQVSEFAQAQEQQAEPVAWNAGVAPMWPQQKEGETFLVSYTTPPQQQAEPVAWDKPSASFNAWWDSYYHDPANPFAEGSAAYWAWSGWKSAQRQWVGLTDDDMKDPKTHILDFIYGARWAEAKLKERNT